MRVMTLNVLFGGEDRMEGILGLVRRASPDVLVLQECLGWDEGDRLRRVAEAIDAPHAHLGIARPRGSGKRYHVALVSRRPIADARTHNDPARLGHAVVEAEIDGVRIYGAHFDSHGEDLRVREAEFVNAIADFSRPCLLAGDLNALSTRDPYPEDLPALLKRAGVDKYGHPPRFDAVRALERAGWIDARPTGDWVTARRDRGGVHIDYRTDYVFCSSPLWSRFVGARVAPAGAASDHDAVVAEFRDPPSRA